MRALLRPYGAAMRLSRGVARRSDYVRAYRTRLGVCAPAVLSPISRASPTSLQLPRIWLDRGLASTSTELAKESSIVEARGAELVLASPALVVTREFEWGNILVGFEQANRYTIRAAPGGHVVGYIAEEDSLGKTITRNLLRTHRAFRATVLDAHGDPVFVIRRPFYMISTSIYVETPEGEVLGEVHMNWHAWRRRYSMYVDKTQFAQVDSGFLAMDFDMRDENGVRIASLNKDFTGFAREIFTDARQYVLRLKPSYGISAEGLVSDAGTVADFPAEEHDSTALELGHRERAVVLATAISIDFDYFSLHSRGHMGPGMMMPMPIPGGGAGGGAGGAGAGTVVGAEAASEAMMGGGEDNQGDAAEFGSGDGGDVDPASGFEAASGEAPGQGSEWATFEEPDYGFQDDPTNDGMDDDWGSGGGESEGWGSSDGGGDGEGSGGLLELIKSVFFDND